MTLSAHTLPAKVVYIVGGLQVILAISSIILTSQSLDTGALCLVNVDPASSRSQTCDFVYVSAPFLIVFTLTIVAAVARSHLILKRSLLELPSSTSASNLSKPLVGGGTIGISFFAGFWALVLALTLTLRGSQATSQGLPEQSAREALMALVWIIFVGYIATAGAGMANLWISRVPRTDDDLTHTFIVGNHSSAYTYTRALGHTPVA
ncbi:hypothetical protein H632_c1027p0 [Helicosporidium sp. ATCC 50920]|nr:hypothetical protein H632_c1027p0 [Helicosporidium sp. ATCC 50920]|eukprot:KDD74860.1 hypothetical protein H632_c1027p0 [Helicosporidium sp. ATCC 50920]